MNKLILLGIAATLGAARLAFFPANPPVDLQPTSPGTSQTGHLNITGTATVGLLKSQGTVFGASTAPTGFAYGGFFTAASDQGRGFYGYASSPTGLTYGGFFQNASTSGRAVFGLATATTGFNYGGYFQSASTTGRGVIGVATAGTGTSYGVFGKASSPTGYGVYSDGNMSATGVISGNGSGLVNVDAAKLAGQPPSAYLTAVPNPLVLSRSDLFNVIEAFNSGSGTGVAGSAAQGVGVFGSTQGTSSGAGVYGLAVADSGNSSGVHGQANSPIGIGVLGENSATSGNAVGVGGFSYAPAGIGVFGGSNTGIGVQGIANGPSSVGVTGSAFSATGPTIGGSFQASSSIGTGVQGFATSATGATAGVYGRSNSTIGTAIKGLASAATGMTYAGYFESSSSSGRGLYGRAASATGNTYGVYGRTDSTTGIGTFGIAPASSGSTIGVFGESSSSDGRGVFGFATSGSGTVYGVMGTAGNNGFAVYANGNFAASGTKAFRIDHPDHPDSQYLLHYSTESPVPQNFYVGNVVTDEAGYAWVELPGYFSAINANVKYHLTVVDDDDANGFALAKVSKKIRGNRFQIRTSLPRVEVSWRIDADRNDPFTRRYPAKDVVEKVGLERGTYQHPELYGRGDGARLFSNSGRNDGPHPD